MFDFHHFFDSLFVAHTSDHDVSHEGKQNSLRRGGSSLFKGTSLLNECTPPEQYCLRYYVGIM
jgi:hypothetical protein